MSETFKVVGTGEQCPCKKVIDLKIEVGGLIEKIARLEHKLDVAYKLLDKERKQ